MTGSEPDPLAARTQGHPPKWLLVSLLSVGLVAPLLQVLALATEVKIVADNLGALIASTAGVSIAAFSALGGIYGRTYIWVNVRPGIDRFTPATIDAGFTKHASIELGEQLPVEFARHDPSHKNGVVDTRLARVRTGWGEKHGSTPGC